MVALIPLCFCVCLCTCMCIGDDQSKNGLLIVPLKDSYSEPQVVYVKRHKNSFDAKEIKRYSSYHGNYNAPIPSAPHIENENLI